MGERTARGLRRPEPRSASARTRSAPTRRSGRAAPARSAGPRIDVLRPPWAARFGMPLFFVFASSLLFVGAAVGPASRPIGVLLIVGTVALAVSGLFLFRSARVAVHIGETELVVRNLTRSYRIRYADLEAIRPARIDVGNQGFRQEILEMRAIFGGQNIRLGATCSNTDGVDIAALGPFLDRLRGLADQHGFDLVRPI